MKIEERLTPEHGWMNASYDTWEICGLDSVCKRDCWKPEPCKIPKMLYRLAEYESAGLSPAEITDHEEMFKAYRHACGGLSPEEVKTMRNRQIPKEPHDQYEFYDGVVYGVCWGCGNHNPIKQSYCGKCGQRLK